MYKRDYFKIWLIIFVLIGIAPFCCNAQSTENAQLRHKVSLKQAHVGSLHIDTLLLDSYGMLPEHIRQFYLDARFLLSRNKDTDFKNQKILESAQKHKITLIGGPMLGNLSEDGVIVWLRSVEATSLLIKVFSSDGNIEKLYSKEISQPGEVQRIKLNELKSDTYYHYVSVKK